MLKKKIKSAILTIKKEDKSAILLTTGSSKVCAKMCAGHTSMYINVCAHSVLWEAQNRRAFNCLHLCTWANAVL